MKFILSLILFVCIDTSVAQTAVQNDVKTMRVRVGPAQIVKGPSNFLDNYFNTNIVTNGYGNTGATAYRSYVANSTTYGFDSPSPRQIGGSNSLNSTIVPGSTLGWATFARCGLWFEDIVKHQGVFYAMAHAENKLDPMCLDIAQTHKSMAVMSSLDQGLNWTMVGQSLNNAENPQANKVTGEGDCTVVSDADYRYMYCLSIKNSSSANPDYDYIVARSAVTSPPTPGYWQKYNGGWGVFQPAQGGLSTKLFHYPNSSNYSEKVVYGSISKWTYKNYVMVASTPITKYGLTVSFSSDRINFAKLNDPLLLTDDSVSIGRRSVTTPSELIQYPSVIAPTGGRHWTDTFVLTHSYVEPYSTGANSQYLVFRDVTISTGSSPANSTTPQVGVELTKWTKPSSNSQPPVIWTTTAPVPPELGLTRAGSLGYVMTKPLSGVATIPLFEYKSYWPSIKNSSGAVVVSIADNLATDQKIKYFDASLGIPPPIVGVTNVPFPTPIEDQYLFQRTIGYVYKNFQPNTLSLFRCAPNSTSGYKSHFISNFDTCDGNGTSEGLLGYALAN